MAGRRRRDATARTESRSRGRSPSKELLPKRTAVPQNRCDRDRYRKGGAGTDERDRNMPRRCGRDTSTPTRPARGRSSMSTGESRAVTARPPSVASATHGGTRRGRRDGRGAADDMRVVCAWCVREGRSGYLGERAPLDDPTPTHAICGRHQELLLETLPSTSFPDVDTLIVVHPKDIALYEYLRRAVTGVRGVNVIIDRREGDRRREQDGTAEDRRRVRRRVRRGISLQRCTLVRFGRRGVGLESPSSAQRSASPNPRVKDLLADPEPSVDFSDPA